MFSGTFIFFVAIAVLLASIFILLEVLSLTSRKKVSKIFCDEDGNIKWLLVISAISSLIGCIILFLFIIIVYKQKILNLTPVKEDLAHYGQYGDFIGGVVATLFSLTGVLLLYETLKTQRNQFAEQAKDTVVQRFENKYYEMIKLHRSNVEEMNIQGLILERKVFIPMFYEFRYIYYQAEEFYKQYESDTISDVVKSELVNIAYLIFFFGVGYNSDKTHGELFDKYLRKKFFIELVKELKEKKLNYKNWFGKKGKEGQIKIGSSDTDEVIFKVKYKPFNGHSGKLGHYFRHLFQTVKFVDEQKNKYFSDEVKYNYLKTLRAQLSNFEQLLLYYNTLSVLGHPWKKYISDYHLIKNIPLPYADFGIIPQEYYANEVIEARAKKDRKEFFEWFEIKNLIQKS